MASDNRTLTLKDFIRIEVFPIIAMVLHALGIRWKFLGEKLGAIVLIPQVRSLVKGKKFPKPHKEEVLILTMLGGHVFNTSIDIALAWSLMDRGYKVKVVLDDECLPITENHKVGREKLYSYVSHLDFLIGSKYFNAAKIEVMRLSDLLKDYSWQNEECKQFDYIVEASLFKHYKVGQLDEKLPLLSEKRRMFEEAVKKTSSMGKILAKKKPGFVIMSHGIYSTWGPAYIHFRESNIPVLTYGRGKKAYTEKFNWNQTGDWWDVSEEWQKVKDIDLTEAQKKKINNYLEARISHKDDVLVYNFGGVEAKDVLRKRLGIDPGKVTFSLFTNVLWDAASAQREIVFSNPIQWVIETISWFADHPEKQLIIKIHPAEVVIGTNQPFKEILKSKLTAIPENVIIIEPDAIINSWSVYDISDIGIVHTTTAGMEMPLTGKPCLVVSRTHFREKGFTIDVNSKEEYFKFLDSFSSVSLPPSYLESIKEYAYKYAYLLFERYQLPFRLFNEYGSLNIKSFKAESFQELINHGDLVFVADCIDKKNDFLLQE